MVKAELDLRQRVDTIATENVLLSRHASPFSNGRIEERLLKAAGRGIYDFDDALMVAPGSGLRNTIWSKQKTWQLSVDSADVVIAGNSFLAEAASKRNSSVVEIPSCVEPDSYRLKQSYEIQTVPTAVWLGSPSTEAYLAMISAPLLSAHRETGLRLRLISAGHAPLGELDQMVDRVLWTESAVAEHLATSDLGLMPLADGEWERGKCAYKLLQYGAAGLPMVGSPVGANSDVLERSDGVAASSLREWRDALVDLVREPTSRRRERGRKGRKVVTDHYSFRAWSAVWRRAVGLAD